MFLIKLNWFAHLLGVTALHLISCFYLSTEDATAEATTKHCVPFVH